MHSAHATVRIIETVSSRNASASCAARSAPSSGMRRVFTDPGMGGLAKMQMMASGMKICFLSSKTAALHWLWARGFLRKIPQQGFLVKPVHCFMLLWESAPISSRKALRAIRPSHHTSTTIAASPPQSKRRPAIPELGRPRRRSEISFITEPR